MTCEAGQTYSIRMHHGSTPYGLLMLTKDSWQGHYLTSLLNCMRVSATGVSRVKVIGVTSEYLIQYVIYWASRWALYDSVLQFI